MEWLDGISPISSEKPLLVFQTLENKGGFSSTLQSRLKFLPGIFRISESSKTRGVSLQTGGFSLEIGLIHVCSRFLKYFPGYFSKSCHLHRSHLSADLRLVLLRAGGCQWFGKKRLHFCCATYIPVNLWSGAVAPCVFLGR